MCVVELIVSTQPCRHRWYHILEGCAPDTGLDKCPEVIQIRGMEKKVPHCQFCDYGMDTNSHEYRFIGSDLNPPSTIAGWSQPSTPRKLEWAKKNVAANERMSAYLRVYGHQHEPAEDLGSHVITDEDSPEPPWKSCKEGKAPISGADKVSAKMTKWGKKGLSKVSSKAS